MVLDKTIIKLLSHLIRRFIIIIIFFLWRSSEKMNLISKNYAAFIPLKLILHSVLIFKLYMYTIKLVA